MTLASFGLLLGTVDASNPDTIHYPDLQTWKAYDLRIDRSGGRKLLRFSNTVANRGQGPLEVAPVHKPDGTTDGYQQLYSHDSAGNWYIAGQTFVGTFSFHPEHDHWHFEDFALYELRNVAPDGSVGGEVLRSSKVTFCMVDNTRDDATLEHAAPQTYTTCGVEIPQGISVGWADTYPYWLPDQDLDITNVPNGDYWLISTADPSNRLNEGGGARETNNSAARKIRLRANKVQILQ